MKCVYYPGTRRTYLMDGSTCIRVSRGYTKMIVKVGHGKLLVSPEVIKICPV